MFRTTGLTFKQYAFSYVSIGYPSWYAVEKIDESIDDTKSFLLPFDLGTWLRMALVVLFTGGFISAAPITGPSDIDQQDFGVSEDIEGGDFSRFNDTFVLLILGTVGGLILLLSYIGSVFRFIFFQSVDEKRPRIISGFKDHWLNGLKYFFFRLLMTGIGISAFTGLILAMGAGSLSAVITAFFLMTPLWIVMYLISFAVKNFTVPRMMTKDSGFIRSTSLAFGSFRKEWKQFGVFLLVKITLAIVIATVSGIANLIVLLTVGLPLVFILMMA